MFGLGQFGRTATAPFAFALAAPWMLAGCGEAPEAKVPVIPVQGTLTVEGEKVEGARITLHPQGHPIPEGRVAAGQTKADGTFEVSIYDEPKGIPAGEYVGTVVWYKPVDGSTGPNVIPKSYTSPDTSPIKVSVKDSAVTLPPIDVRK